MKTVLFSVSLVALVCSVSFAAENEKKEVLNAGNPATWSDKFAELPVESMEIEIDLTAQMCRVRDTRTTPSLVICESPCSTGAGKFADIYPKDGLTHIVATGTEGENMTRTNHDGVKMVHFMRFDINTHNGKPAVVGMHAGNGETVSRLPSTHGCIRLPKSVAHALAAKVRGTKLGSVKFKVPVRFVGTTPSVW